MCLSNYSLIILRYLSLSPSLILLSISTRPFSLFIFFFLKSSLFVDLLLYYYQISEVRSSTQIVLGVNSRLFVRLSHEVERKEVCMYSALYLSSLLYLPRCPTFLIFSIFFRCNMRSKSPPYWILSVYSSWLFT